MIGVTRRDLLAGAAALGAVALIPGLARAAWTEDRGPSIEQRMLKVGERSTVLYLFVPGGEVKGVALFSTGLGSSPTRYIRVMQLLNAAGFAVFAPVHVDSLEHPDHTSFTRQQSLGARFQDLEAATNAAAAAFPGVPMIAVGHSYGSLIAFGEGGALADVMPVRNPAVKAVLAFSTPGRIPGLVTEKTYTSIAVPLFEISGTHDTLPSGTGSSLNEPADHLLPVALSPVTAFGLVVQGADHALVDDAARLERVAPAVDLFLRGYGLDEADAQRALLHWRAAGPDRFMAYEKSR